MPIGGIGLGAGPSWAMGLTSEMGHRMEWMAKRAKHTKQTERVWS